MKSTRWKRINAILCATTLVTLTFTVAPAQEEIEFGELEKRLTFDREPVAKGQGDVVSYADALEKVMPAVVSIYSAKKIPVQRNRQQEDLFRRMFPDIPEDFFERHSPDGERRQEGLGSGVIISPDGYILTNNHVVANADEIKVSLANDKREYEATMVGADPQTDVALIKIDAKGLDTITIGDSGKLRIGDVVIAAGNPLGLEQTATIGIVSAIGRTDLNITGGGYENFIQTDASINRGNSGGPLVDARGRLVGVNTAISSGLSGGNIGIGFAIPSNMALNIVRKLLEGDGTVARGFLGVYLRNLDEAYARAFGRKDLAGAVVAEVGPNTPAEKAGMKAGDIIVGYNGKPVSEMQRLRLDISNTDPGSEVTFDIVRKGKTKKLDVVLGDLEQRQAVFAGAPNEQPEEPEAKQLLKGVTIVDLDEETRESLNVDEEFAGVLVESVNEDAPAAEAGLAPGVVITQIDQQDVESVADARQVLENVDGDVLLIQVYAGGGKNILAIPLDEE